MCVLCLLDFPGAKAIPPAPSSGGYFHRPAADDRRPSHLSTEGVAGSPSNRTSSPYPPSPSPVAEATFEMGSFTDPSQSPPPQPTTSTTTTPPVVITRTTSEGKSQVNTATPPHQGKKSTSTNNLLGFDKPVSVANAALRILNPVERPSAVGEEGDGGESIADLRGTVRRLQKEVKELNLENDDYEHR